MVICYTRKQIRNGKANEPFNGMHADSSHFLTKCCFLNSKTVSVYPLALHQLVIQCYRLNVFVSQNSNIKVELRQSTSLVT